jgi:membrane protease YdiL (CAAX protease family)
VAGRLRSIVVLAVVALAYAAFRVLGAPGRLPFGPSWADATEGVLKIGLWVLPCALVLRAMGASSYREVLAELGMSGGDTRIGRGYAFGLLASLPMLVILPFGLPAHLDVQDVVGSVLLGPFAEEVLFRGFLFRQLYRHARWPPAVAMIASALAFGLAHLGNVNLQAPHGAWLGFAQVATTAGGGLLFAWMLFRLGSLWPVIGLHTFMNLSWQLFGVDDWAAAAQAGATAIGPAAANIARVATVTLAVYLTITRSVRRADL